MHSKCFALIPYHESDVRCCLVIYALDRFRLRDLYDPLKLICYVRTRMRACFINDVGMRSRVKSVRAWISMRSSIQPRHIRSSRYNTLSLHNTLFSGAQASLYQMRQKQTSLRSMCFCEVVRLHTKNKYNRSILCVCLIFWLHFYLLLLLVFFFSLWQCCFQDLLNCSSNALSRLLLYRERKYRTNWLSTWLQILQIGLVQSLLFQVAYQTGLRECQNQNKKKINK